jgi:2-oxoglutarate dehydrogenase E2 component (dihydrolipoamide succinyltransferase)
MAIEVKIPAMGESISNGLLAAWHVNNGDFVEKDQILYELETDKVTTEGRAEASGVISIQVGADEEVDIGQVVATIDPSASAPPKGAASAASKGKGEREGEASPVPESGEAELPSSPKVDPVATLSPAARKAAEETGVDPAKLAGSGKDGRVTKNDILEAAKTVKTANATQPQPEADKSLPPAPPAAARGSRETRQRMSPLRRKIAERLVAATQQAAMLTTFNEVDMGAVMELRKLYQDEFVKRHGMKLGFMSFFTKAVTHALQAVPQVNARIEGNEIVTQHYYDIGVAVSTEKGLMVPVLRDCDQKGFAEIEGDILAYAEAAREGKIQMGDLEGGVFTISNGGIYGSMLSTPIINFPQPAILGLHNIIERAVVVDGEIVARPMMYLALSYDHRLIDGKEAVIFLTKIKQVIEDPSRLLIGV